ncbi:MAG: SCP-like extracellular [Thiotrichaceae bacterium]|nr:SCP-like extracellular [Thiotrichaceae bacterium]
MLLNLHIIAVFTLLTVLVSCSSPHTVGRVDQPVPRLPVDLPTVNPSEVMIGHNKVRQKHQLNVLVWSDALAKFSQQWANHLKMTNRCKMRHRPHSGQHKTNYGENLFWASPLQWSDGRTEIQRITSTRVIDDWASEIEFYNLATNRCQPNQQCGHYTQLVWRNTQQVGCARAICNDKSQVWVCSYDPSGNWAGQRPY